MVAMVDAIARLVPGVLGNAASPEEESFSADLLEYPQYTRPESWREQIAWIGQRPVLFHGTIRENILLGRPQATDEQIQQAAGQSRVLDFTMHLPEGLETRVGELGAGISRGQAQRVALARAFLKDAPPLDAKNHNTIDIANIILPAPKIKGFVFSTTS